MNLNEAAETMRRYYDPKDQFDGPCGTAPEVLQFAMLSELDPTPITEEWLWENGARERELVPGCFIIQGHDIDAMGESEWMFDDFRTITTLGELRTLLRLCGAQEKENDV